MTLDIWEKRWLAANDAMSKLASEFERLATSLPQAESYWATTLRFVTLSLQAFAESFFYLFFDTYTQSSYELERHTLEPELPADFVLYAILRQVADDLEVIQRAAGQRSLPLKGKLAMADKLAWEALQPLRSAVDRLDDHTTVLTYFQKSPDVRVIPYAPVALIGLELSAGHSTDTSEKHVPQDFLAIPHEVGHYVFWRGKLDDGTRIHESFRGGDVPPDLEWCERWIEEIFADVYGCWLGGPVMALAAQDVQRTNPPDRFSVDDGEHPVPALRPDIYAKVLGPQEDVPTALTTELAGEWMGFRAGQPGGGKFEVSGGREVSVDDAISPLVTIEPDRPVDAVIEAALQRLGGLTASGNKWRDYLTPTLTKSALYHEFESSTLFSSSVSPAAFDAVNALSLWNTWVGQLAARVKPDFDPSILHRGAGISGRKAEIPSEVWKAILFAEGWTTRFARSWKR